GRARRGRSRTAVVRSGHDLRRDLRDVGVPGRSVVSAEPDPRPLRARDRRSGLAGCVPGVPHRSKQHAGATNPLRGRTDPLRTTLTWIGFPRKERARAHFPQEPYYIELRSAAVDPQGTNRLEAICTTEDDGEGVPLTFLVNGRQVARATDRDRPLSSGTVGLLVATGGSNAEQIEAE